MSSTAGQTAFLDVYKVIKIHWVCLIFPVSVLVFVLEISKSCKSGAKYYLYEIFVSVLHPPLQHHSHVVVLLPNSSKL